MWGRRHAHELAAEEADDAQPEAPPRKHRLPFALRLAARASVLTATAGCAVFSIAMIYYTVRFPDPAALRRPDPSPVIRVLARDGALLTRRGSSHEFARYEQLPAHLVKAVVAIEDRRFFHHHGVDLTGLLRATLVNLRAGRYVQGGSTLTQQLAKNLFLSSDRTLGRKLQELLLSVWLEIRLSKQDILALYLNRVYFGGGAYGIEAASRRFFGKGARELTLAESAVIAGLLKAPSRFSPSTNLAQARERAQVVLASMERAGFLTSLDARRANLDAVQLASAEHAQAETGLEYAVEYVLDRLPPLLGDTHREIIVETTIDAGLQRTAQSAVAHALTAEGMSAGATQAGLVVLDPDGGVRALVGGRSWAQSQYNRAVKARRQPGSAFKPIVYLAAVEQGAGPDTVVEDRPVVIDGWRPRNDHGAHRGAITLRQALAHSVNTVAVSLQQDLGARRVTDLARRLGVRSELREDPSLALGTSEVTLLELTGAYDVLASGGYAVEPHAILRVRTGDGRILYERSALRPALVVSPRAVRLMSDMLHAAVISGTGRRAAFPTHPAAGKTGTTQDFRDAWFVGYTAYLTAGVWVGNDSGRAMRRVVGGGLPARIWREVMMAAHAGLPARPLSSPEPGAPPTARPEAIAAAPPHAHTTALVPSSATWTRSPFPGPVTPPAKAKARPQLADRHLPAMPKMPREPIDPALFERALAMPVPAPAAAPLDTARLERRLKSATPDGQMGLGAR